MAKKVMTPAAIILHNEASKMYGKGLWETVTELAEGPVSNTMDNALPSDTDIRKLAGPAMYWLESNRGGVPQIVVVPGDGGWYYAGVIRDKDGEPVESDNNTYAIRDVRAKSEYKLVDAQKNPILNDKGQQVIIPKGFLTAKAYAI